MEPIVELPDSIEIPDDDGMRLVRVSFESGGEEFDEIDVYDRVEWMEQFCSERTWRILASQEEGNYSAKTDEDKRMVRVKLPGWWVDEEHKDADRTDPTWRGSYGRVFGEEWTFAALDYEWSAGRAAWSFPELMNEDGEWLSPGRFGVGGPKSLLDVIFPVGEPDAADRERLSMREAREAAPNSKSTPEYDWEAAVEKAEERAESMPDADEVEMDMSAIEALDEYGPATKNAAVKPFVKFNEVYEAEFGSTPHPALLSLVAEATAEAVRRADGRDDPRPDGAGWDNEQ
jgi:hypothetical protein